MLAITAEGYVKALRRDVESICRTVSAVAPIAVEPSVSAPGPDPGRSCGRLLRVAHQAAQEAHADARGGDHRHQRRPEHHAGEALHVVDVLGDDLVRPTGTDRVI